MYVSPYFEDRPDYTILLNGVPVLFSLGDSLNFVYTNYQKSRAAKSLVYNHFIEISYKTGYLYYLDLYDIVELCESYMWLKKIKFMDSFNRKRLESEKFNDYAERAIERRAIQKHASGISGTHV